jgi:hypothetical protein
MKKVLMGMAAALIVAGVGGYVFRAPLLEAATDRMTADMFVARDTDSYDPGVAAGQPFPAIRARYQDREVADIGEFMGPRGMVIYVNRSVDW